MAASGAEERKDWELQKESELRLEVDENQQVVIRLDSGTAEVFGSELARGKEYKLLSRSKVAVFTWYGCTLVVMGHPSVAYISTETPSIMYLNLHVAVDQRRFDAEKEDKMGPRIVVCGQTDVGKTTLCRLLLNYAVRMGRRPLFVDLDIGQGSISIPGSMGLAEVDRVADAVEGFHELVPMVFHYGHLSPDANEKLYRALTSTLAMTFERRCEVNKTNRYSGCVVNTCGWVDGLGYKILEHACLAFDASLVLVLDNERLLYDLKRNLPEGVDVLHLPKSGGVVQRSRAYRKESRKEAVREYFYGKLGGAPYFPFSFDVPFSEVQIYKIGAPQDQEHLLPSGHKKKDRSLQLSLLEPNKELTHHVLSVSMAESVEEDVVKTNSAGFLLVTFVDMEKEQMTVLSPAPKPLPRTMLLLSDVTYMDIQ